MDEASSEPPQWLCWISRYHDQGAFQPTEEDTCPRQAAGLCQQPLPWEQIVYCFGTSAMCIHCRTEGGHAGGCAAFGWLCVKESIMMRRHRRVPAGARSLEHVHALRWSLHLAAKEADKAGIGCRYTCTLSHIPLLITESVCARTHTPTHTPTHRHIHIRKIRGLGALHRQPRYGVEVARVLGVGMIHASEKVFGRRCLRRGDV